MKFLVVRKSLRATLAKYGANSMMFHHIAFQNELVAKIAKLFLAQLSKIFFRRSLKNQIRSEKGFKYKFSNEVEIE